MLRGLDFRHLGADIVKRPFITIGFIALLAMLPMAATSTARAMRRLGRRWQRIHYLVYPVAILGVWHYWWQVKADVRASTVYIETDGTMVIPNGLTAVETSWGSRGTGFIMTSNGHVVTNSHVAVGQGLYTLTVEGRPRAINAELVAIAECEDLAVLRLVSGAPYPALSWSAETRRRGGP